MNAFRIRLVDFRLVQNVSNIHNSYYTYHYAMRKNESIHKKQIKKPENV